MNNSNNKNEKNDFIDLDKSQFKKKRSWIKYFFFISIVSLFPILLFILNDRGYLENFFNSDNISKTVNSESKVSRDFQELVLIEKEQLKKEILELEKKILNLDLKVTENSREISNYELQTKEIKNKIDVITTKFVESGTSIANLSSENIFESNTNSEQFNKILINFLLLKMNFLERLNIQTQITALKQFLNFNPQISNLLNEIEKIDIEAIPKDTYFLDKINSALNKYKITTEEFIKKIEEDETETKKNIFKSKEEFTNYLKQLFNSTIKITKVQSQSLENDFVDENYITTKINKLLKAKEYVLNNDLQTAVELVSKNNQFNEAEITEIIFKANTYINSKKNIKSLEILIFQYLGDLTG